MFFLLSYLGCFLGWIKCFESPPGVWSAADLSYQSLPAELANGGFSPAVAGKLHSPRTGDHPGPDQQCDGGGLRDRAEVNHLGNLTEGAGTVGEGRNKPRPMLAFPNCEPMGETAVKRLLREDVLDPGRQTVNGAAAVGPGNLNHAMPKHRTQHRIKQSTAARDSRADFGSVEKHSCRVRTSHDVAHNLADGEPYILWQFEVIFPGGFHWGFPVVGRAFGIGDNGGVGRGKGGFSRFRVHGVCWGGFMLSHGGSANLTSVLASDIFTQ